MGLSIGRTLLCVLLAYTAYERGPVAGASVGLGLGLTADLCAGTGSGIFTAGLGLAGLLTGSRAGRGRSSAALAFVAAAMAALLPARDPWHSRCCLKVWQVQAAFCCCPDGCSAASGFAARNPPRRPSLPPTQRAAQSGGHRPAGTL